MKPEGLRHRITIQYKTVTQDAIGNEIETWHTFATVWAAIEPISGREYFAAAQTNAEVNHRIKIRPLPGVNSEMRAVWDNRIFEIEAVLNIKEKNVEVHLMCKEAVAGG